LDLIKDYGVGVKSEVDFLTRRKNKNKGTLRRSRGAESLSLPGKGGGVGDERGGIKKARGFKCGGPKAWSQEVS